MKLAMGRGFPEVHITDGTLVVTSVNDYSAGLQPASLHEVWMTNGRYNEVRSPDDRWQFAGVRMAIGHSRITSEEKHPNGLAKDRAATDDHSMHPLWVDVVFVQ